jgi:hypothetical protein
MPVQHTSVATFITFGISHTISVLASATSASGHGRSSVSALGGIGLTQATRDSASNVVMSFIFLYPLSKTVD